MGKPRPHAPAVGSEEERIRALTRELHEHTKAARDAERDLRVAEADADRARARLEETADMTVAAAVLAMDTTFAEARKDAERLVQEFHARFREVVAELAGLPTGEALLDRVTQGIGQVIRPVVDTAVARALEHRLSQVLTLPDREPARGKRSP